VAAFMPTLGLEPRLFHELVGETPVSVVLLTVYMCDPVTA